ncbi:RNA-directed DNA polymerase from mobile element jockey [Trichonephila clavipes]|nr:RNA-directed DNA polymerase from mobile element jockey [Trichonephila clavipes]
MIILNFPSYIIHFINSYLSDRTFQVKIRATLSRIGTVSAGSPQDSNLSPMLYNIYTHDFPTTPTVDVCLFADDAAIIAQACNPDMQFNPPPLRPDSIIILATRLRFLAFFKIEHLPSLTLPPFKRNQWFFPPATQREVQFLFSPNLGERKWRHAQLICHSGSTSPPPLQSPDSFRHFFFFSQTSALRRTHCWCVGAPSKEYVPRATFSTVRVLPNGPPLDRKPLKVVRLAASLSVRHRFVPP